MASCATARSSSTAERLGEQALYQIKRVYEPAQPSDGCRILVDRLWPRGLSKEAAAIDIWLKDIAPSPELRTWFGHDVARWAGFQTRYLEELKSPERSAAFDHLEAVQREKGVVTLLFGARDEVHNHAALLLRILKGDPVR